MKKTPPLSVAEQLKQRGIPSLVEQFKKDFLVAHYAQQCLAFQEDDFLIDLKSQ